MGPGNEHWRNVEDRIPPFGTVPIVAGSIVRFADIAQFGTLLGAIYAYIVRCFSSCVHVGGADGTSDWQTVLVCGTNPYGIVAMVTVRAFARDSGQL